MHLAQFNMSVWTSRDALHAFVYDTDHVAVMRRRREWFARMAEAYLALWWVLAGTVPTVAEAQERLTHLSERGPSPRAFTFRDWHDPERLLGGGDHEEAFIERLDPHLGSVDSLATGDGQDKGVGQAEPSPGPDLRGSSGHHLIDRDHLYPEPLEHDVDPLNEGDSPLGRTNDDLGVVHR